MWHGHLLVGNYCLLISGFSYFANSYPKKDNPTGKNLKGCLYCFNCNLTWNYSALSGLVIELA